MSALSNKVAINTGENSGMDYATATLCAREGARVGSHTVRLLGLAALTLFSGSLAMEFLNVRL